MTENCNLIGCTNDAEFEVVFALRVHANHPPAISTPIIKVCAEHNDVKWDDVCNEKGWNQIVSGMLAAGKAAPTKKYSYIEIRPIQ